MIEMRNTTVTLLLSGIGFGQGPTVGPKDESTLGEGITGIEEPCVHTALHEALSLGDSQAVRLAEFNFTLTDQEFPLIHDTLDKAWEFDLRRAAGSPRQRWF